MKWRVYWLAFGVFVMTLAYNAWYWGGAARIADLGPIIATAAAREAPLVDAYLSIGGQLLTWTGQTAAATASAEAAFASLRAPILEQPRLAIDLLFGSHQQTTALSLLRVSHWLCPLTLVIGLFGWLRRPQAIQTHKLGRRF